MKTSTFMMVVNTNKTFNKVGREKAEELNELTKYM